MATIAMAQPNACIAIVYLALIYIYHTSVYLAAVVHLTPLPNAAVQ
jgi:hypothetical protein